MEKQLKYGKIVVKETPNSIKISLYEKNGIWGIFLFVIVFCIWGIIEHSTLKNFSNLSYREVGKLIIQGNFFFILESFWAIFWNIAGIRIFWEFILSIFGVAKEEIVVNTDSFIISGEVYNLKEIRNFYVRKDKGFQRKGERFPDTIRFDYHAKTIDFGGQIEEEEGKFILDILREKGFLKEQHFGQYSQEKHEIKTAESESCYLQDTHDGAKLVFEAAGNILVKIIIAIFLIFWLRIWLVGETFAYTILSGNIEAFFYQNIDFSDKKILALTIFTIFFLSIWITLWTFGGLAAAYYLLFLFFIKTEIEIKHGFLIISKKLGFIRYSRKAYNLFEATNFHARRDFGYSREGKNYPATIRFTYKNELISFGEGIDEAEGRAVLEAFRAKKLLTDYHFSHK